MLYAAIGFLVNTKTITLADEVLLVKTRPLPFSRTLLLPVSGITKVEVEETFHSSSGLKWCEDAVIVTHEAVGREKLIKFRDAEPAAHYIHDRLVARLSLGVQD